jgi:hypothetical protein
LSTGSPASIGSGERRAALAALRRLGSTGCPPITRYSFDFGPVRISGSLRPDDGVATAYCPRRTVLDYLLVEAAAAAGRALSSSARAADQPGQQPQPQHPDDQDAHIAAQELQGPVGQRGRPSSRGWPTLTRWLPATEPPLV